MNQILAMAETDNIKFVIDIPISRYVSSLVIILSSLSSLAVGQCHAQWWFPTTLAPPPSPSVLTPINVTTSTTPVTGSTSPPAGWTGFPATPAAPPPSPATTTPTTTCTTLIVMTSSSPSFGPLIRCFYTSVQSAIDAVPDNNTGLVTIQILPGTYTEKVSIPSSKPFITVQGAGRTSTIITYNDTANSTGSTVKSATFSVFAANFTARNITFQNTAPHALAGQSGAQAVASLIWGDMAAFYGCGFVSSQDTICDQDGRHYFRDCYVEGNIDVIWGNGQSLYEYCDIKSTADNNSGCITAQSRASEADTTGFAFVGGSITGTGKNLLGRAYGSYSRVLFIHTFMEGVINPLGWSDWPSAVNYATSNRHYYYGEYGNTGPGANLTSRVSWMKVLDDAQAANFSSLGFIDGTLWLASET